jgi:hypothetical protein
MRSFFLKDLSKLTSLYQACLFTVDGQLVWRLHSNGTLSSGFAYNVLMDPVIHLILGNIIWKTQNIENNQNIPIVARQGSSANYRQPHQKELAPPQSLCNVWIPDGREGATSLLRLHHSTTYIYIYIWNNGTQSLSII